MSAPLMYDGDNQGITEKAVLPALRLLKSLSTSNNKTVRKLCLKARSEGRVKENISVIGLEQLFFELRNTVSFWDPEGADTGEAEIFLLQIMQALGMMVISSSTAEM